MKLVGMVLLLLLSFSSCGEDGLLRLCLTSLLEWRKRSSSNNEGLVLKKRSESSGERERREVETLFRGRCQEGVVSDEVERHDFRNLV